MESTASPVLPRYLRNSLLLGVAVAILLVVSGRLLVPGMSYGSTMAALVILLAYGGLAMVCPAWLCHRDPDVLRGAIVFGLLAGGVFAAMGATFFHLSLGLFVAAVLGVFGGLVGKVLAWFRR